VKRLRAALQFMTTLPLGRPVRLAPAAMAPFFPLTGLLLGLITALRTWPSAACGPRALPPYWTPYCSSS